MTSTDTIFDWSRKARTGLPEAVYAEHKSVEQLRDIFEQHRARAQALLMTRLTVGQSAALSDLPLMIDPVGRTATYLAPTPANDAPEIAIVAAGSSDLPVAREAEVCARFLGLQTRVFVDVGVAGLWRLEQHLEYLSTCRLIIAVAGMEGALFSVLAGLTFAPMIAVPTSIGYGVAEAGKGALIAALSSCSPGVVCVNIDNGFGAAAAAKKLLGRSDGR